MDVAELSPKAKAEPTAMLPFSRVIDISFELDPKTFRMQVPDGFDKDAQFEVEVIKPYSTGDGQIVRWEILEAGGEFFGGFEKGG